MSLRPVRGTHDVFGDDARRHRRVVETGREVAGRYGFEPIDTPVFELTSVFHRTLGDSSDVVTKETYTFPDRGGESLTLRPEGTASVCRAAVTNNLLQTPPARLFYAGPMFRYERPQKGRLRQFHQIGVELLGAAEPAADVETIACGARVLAELGLVLGGDGPGGVTLELNSLGDRESRAVYRTALVAHLERRQDELSPESRERLARNPLRVLDSKDEGDRRVVADAPLLSDHLNETSRAFYVEVKAGLDALAVPYVDNPRLVRGLDYYGHTAFEFTTKHLGAQGTVLAGGRYDGLVETLTGTAKPGVPGTPGVGWAAGVERLAMLLPEPPPAPRPVAVVPVDEAAAGFCLVLAEELRAAGLIVEHAYRGRAGQRLKRAARANARYAVVVGADEMASGFPQLRDLDEGVQRPVPRGELIARLCGRGPVASQG